MTKAQRTAREKVLGILRTVTDPEIPFIDVVELGVVRDIHIDDDRVTVDITPTYSGCPAMRVIERDIVDALHSHGFGDVSVETIYSPAWTTDWMSEETKKKFRDHGIAPPGAARSDGGIAELVSIRRARPALQCPYCGSSSTVEKSEFGSTACKAIHFCNSCHQPFDSFKAF